ncbi:MAG: class I adenylate-forming enzyme family protein [Bacilli bacterium]|nr:class I adenylate-forming enzyme family protein [Bacilli bacterium]
MSSNTGYLSIDNRHNDNKNYFQRNPIIPNMSVYNIIGMISSLYSDSFAIDCLDLRVTYQELIASANVLARSYKELGIKKGDIIVASMPNFFQALAVYLGANKIGAVTSFLNPGCSKEEIKYYLNEFGSPLYINYDQSIEYNSEIKRDTKVKQTITLHKKDINIKTFNDVKKGDIGYNDYLSFNDMKLVADYYKGFINPYQSSSNDALILFTSGSSGQPKSVVLTNKNIIASGIYMKNTGNIVTKHGEKCLICVPFSYPYGLVTSTIMTLLSGREAILAPNMNMNNVNYFLRKNPNYVFGSPAILELFVRAIEESLDLSSLQYFISGGDFLSPAKVRNGIEIFRKHNSMANIYIGSGNAETAGASTIAIGSPVKIDTVGRILTGSRAVMLALDKNGKIKKPYTEVKYNEEGSLCISGDHVFKKYYNDKELTSENKLIYNGREYLITGAVGTVDDKGYFYMTGRASRFYIKADSNKVYLEHLQRILSYIDVVDDCVAVPIPNDEELFQTKVFIKLKQGIEPSEQIKKYLIYQMQQPFDTKDKIAPLKTFEIPSSIEFVDTMKRIIDSEKIDYRYYEKLAMEEYEVQKNNSRTK